MPPIVAGTWMSSHLHREEMAPGGATGASCALFEATSEEPAIPVEPPLGLDEVPDPILDAFFDEIGSA